MAPQHEEDLCLLAGTLPMNVQGVAADDRDPPMAPARGCARLGIAGFLPPVSGTCGLQFDAGEASAGNSYALLREACQFAIRQAGVEILAVHACRLHLECPLPRSS